MANHLCHFEFVCGDVEKTKEFYGKVFDWEFEDVPSTVPYTIVRTGAGPDGHMMAKPPEAAHSRLSAYFRVDDVGETLLKATEAGGIIIIPETDVPKVGAFGMFSDPEGVIVGVFQPLESSEAQHGGSARKV